MSGKRKGFSLNDVYVDLDLAVSDLMTSDRIDTPDIPDSYVLLGGPGAGKSTTAKKQIIKHLNRSHNNLPFFIRLKDYGGSEPIIEHIIGKMKQFGFTNPSETLKKNLLNHSLVILDGLDEIRPHLHKRICDEINIFYSNYFNNCGSLIVTCRKEAYRDIPLNIKSIFEVRPLSDEQIKRFANKWPIEYPKSKSSDTFFRDLATSPRIMELTRSPLLLVGGLMHYTEANLGIPKKGMSIYRQWQDGWLLIGPWLRDIRLIHIGMFMIES